MEAKKELTKPLYESPKKESNNELYGETGNECVCCGKPIKSGVVNWVQMNEAWVAVSPEIDEKDFMELTGSASQGAFPLGSDCAKKMKGFTYKAELHEVKKL